MIVENNFIVSVFKRILIFVQGLSNHGISPTSLNQVPPAENINETSVLA